MTRGSPDQPHHPALLREAGLVAKALAELSPFLGNQSRARELLWPQSRISSMGRSAEAGLDSAFSRISVVY